MSQLSGSIALQHGRWMMANSPVQIIWKQVNNLFNEAPGAFTWYSIQDDGNSLKARVASLDPNMETLAFLRNVVGQVTVVKYSPLYKVTIFIDDIAQDSAFGIKAKSMTKLTKCLNALALKIDEVIAQC